MTGVSHDKKYVELVWEWARMLTVLRAPTHVLDRAHLRNGEQYEVHREIAQYGGRVTSRIDDELAHNQWA